MMDYNLLPFLDSSALIQGVVLGILLIAINNRRSKSTLFLGFFIIAYSLELLPSILEDLKIVNSHSTYFLIPFDFTWLLFPLFYVYVKSVSVNSKKNYWLLIPGLIEFSIRVYIFFQSKEVKVEINQSLWYNLIEVLGFIYGIIIGVFIINWIKKHNLEIKNQYASIEHKTLCWAKKFVFFGIAYHLLLILIDVFNINFYGNLILSVANVIMMYWISIKSLLQQNTINMRLYQNDDSKKILVKKDRCKDNDNAKKDASKLFQKIDNYMLTKKAYTKKNLTIVDIANGIDEHPKNISKAINIHLDKNFNTYVNGFRVNMAKELLQKNDMQNLSIEGIGYEVGFQSKSAFYSAFKTSTGTTPSRFKIEKLLLP